MTRSLWPQEHARRAERAITRHRGWTPKHRQAMVDAMPITVTRAKPLRPTVENDAYVEMMRRCVRALGRRIGDGDVEHVGLALALRDEMDAAIAEGVRVLHEAGESWSRIGRAAGMTKQAAQQRWG